MAFTFKKVLGNMAVIFSHAYLLAFLVAFLSFVSFFFEKYLLRD